MNISWETGVSFLRDFVTSPVVALTFTSVVGYKIYRNLSHRFAHPSYDDEDYKRQGHVELPTPLKDLRMSTRNLAIYNANNNNGILLLALEGVIYDVSSCEDFGPNGSLKELTGTDILTYIKKSAKEEGKSFENHLHGWKNMLDDRFYVAGVLLDYDEGSDGDGKQQTEQTAETD
ncbi:uncharacterized protein LOC127565037 [Drosophila albomicans]|uniref:Uncharacterized protein LOC127565037 n=1 Tax=Drosophila albomicans TaxID=7291 RepID=A0A9C6SR37_DROAB|nr:uncharacterized protein LOC127565037 [Drosophila albomicans]